MRTRAFTLIELLVTIVIIGLLATIATTSFVNAQRNARDDARKTAVASIANALEAYKLVRGNYPGLESPSSVEFCTANSTYYYHPTSTCVANGDESEVSGMADGSGAFNPAPNWIPGLGSYLNPPATEVRYVGADGSDAGSGLFDPNTGEPSGANNFTRTLSYKRTATGYGVHAKLERLSELYSITR